MDFNFENRYTVTDENLLKYLKYTILRKRRWRSLIIMCVALGYAVYSAIPPTAATSLLMFVLCVILMLSSILFSPVLSLKSLQKTLIKQEGTKTPNRTLQFGDNIRSIYDNEKKSLVYMQISEVLEAKDMFILTDNRTIAIYVLKNSFTFGEYEDFKSFILKKCHHAKYKKIVNFILPLAINW